MSFTNETTHYGLPQWIGSDKPTYLVDQNNAYQKIDAELYNANTTAGSAVTAAEGAVQTAGAASSTAADALTAAQTASSTADSALLVAQTANTNAQAAQTAAGAAQTAAQAAQEAAAGNSITNLAPAYDPTITYAVNDLVTAEGKLYKCIQAVSSPEQFDINKWDDVTTSEVYARGIVTTTYDILTLNLPANMHVNSSETWEAILDDNVANINLVFNFETTDTATASGWVTIGKLKNRKHHVDVRLFGVLTHDVTGENVCNVAIQSNDDLMFYNGDGTNKITSLIIVGTIIN